MTDSTFDHQLKKWVALRLGFMPARVSMEDQGIWKTHGCPTCDYGSEESHWIYIRGYDVEDKQIFFDEVNLADRFPEFLEEILEA
jgi:hypothetical protein